MFLNIWKITPKIEIVTIGKILLFCLKLKSNQLSIRGGVDLEAGDKVVTVQSITKVDGPQRVYNLEVASLDGQITHNYFVGEDEIWTHNTRLFRGK